MDLEKQKSIDLLPDRETSTLDSWLKDHPGGEIISRDRALSRILDEVMSWQRKTELDLYRLYVKDDAFKQAFFDTLNG